MIKPKQQRVLINLAMAYKEVMLQIKIGIQFLDLYSHMSSLVIHLVLIGKIFLFFIYFFEIRAAL